MPTVVLKADVVLDANCCPKSSQKMLDTKIMCCSVQQPYNHQPQRLIHQKEDDQSAEIINLKDTNRTTNRYLGVLYLFLSWLINLILAL
jgi:hypothetical protein